VIIINLPLIHYITVGQELYDYIIPPSFLHIYRSEMQSLPRSVPPAASQASRSLFAAYPNLPTLLISLLTDYYLARPQQHQLLATLALQGALYLALLRYSFDLS
jgi:hypothetical protein